MNIKLPVLAFVFVAMTASGFGQTRREKTIAIVRSFSGFVGLKEYYDFRIEILSRQLTATDSNRLNDLKRDLSDDEMIQRIASIYDDYFTDDDISVLYDFVQSNAFTVLMSEDIVGAMDNVYEDINSRINDLEREMVPTDVSGPRKTFEPIPIDRINGIYTTINYHDSILPEEMELQKVPVLNPVHIARLSKKFDSNDGSVILEMVLTVEGAEIFYRVTMDNIGEPLLIVFNSQIVSMPIVLEPISNGQVRISGLSEREVDEIIEMWE